LSGGHLPNVRHSIFFGKDFKTLRVGVKNMKIAGRYAVFLSCLIFCFANVTAAQIDLPAQFAELIKKYRTEPSAENLSAARRVGFALIAGGNFAQADAVFAEILTKNPMDGLSSYGRALSLFNLKNYAEAQMNVAAAIEIFGREKEAQASVADALVLSAVISAVTGDNAAALEKLKKAVSLAPNHFDANFSLGRAYFGNNDFENAAGAFRAALKQSPNHVQANFFLATALERDDKKSEAIAVYRNLVKLAPRAAEGYLGAGVLLIKTEGAVSAEGVANLRKAIEINPNLYEAQVTLGKALLQTNKTEESLPHLQKAAALAPGDPEPRYQLLRAYRKLGRKAEAEAEQAIIKKIHESRRGVNSTSKEP
jgi:tetratricopeptide (TPR) repeat protein